MGGLGILDMEKYARSLTLCWPWLTWRNLSGLGWSQVTQRTRTWISSISWRLSPLVMVKPQPFGTLLGFAAASQKILLSPSLPSPRASVFRCRKPCRMDAGLHALISSQALRCNTSSSSWSCGQSYMTKTSSSISRTTLLGTTLLQVNTLLHLPTWPNSITQMTLFWSRWFGNFGRHRSIWPAPTTRVAKLCPMPVMQKGIGDGTT